MPNRALDPLKRCDFAASWSQLGYTIKALLARVGGQSPAYFDDGTRSSAPKMIVQMGVTTKTPRYWGKIRRDLPRDPKAPPRFKFAENCRKWLRKARSLADRHGFDLVVVFLPQNSDFLGRVNWDGPDARREIRKFTSKVREIVPHVVDLTISSFSDSKNFWLDDSTHFKPDVGARLLREAVQRSLGVADVR